MKPDNAEARSGNSGLLVFRWGTTQSGVIEWYGPQRAKAMGVVMAQCKDCGLLSFVQAYEDHELVAVTLDYRRKGTQPPTYFVAGEGNRKRYHDCPQCFVGAFDLWAEMPDDSGWGHGCEISRKDRQCDDFTKYVPGLGPREHADMLQQKAILDYQRQRDADEREWREQQAKRERDWRKEDRDDAASAMRSERYKGWAVAAWTLAAAIITWTISIWVR